MDPLTAFAHFGWAAPYLAEPPYFTRRAMVVAVRAKTPYVIARHGAVPHLHKAVAATFDGGVAQFAAQYMCGDGARDVMVLPGAAARGGVCPRCEDVAEGPCVYRCFGPTGDLLYIGSAGARLRRIKSHEARTAWWPEVAEVKVERFPIIFEARTSERLAIIAEQPLYNRQYRRTA